MLAETTFALQPTCHLKLKVNKYLRELRKPIEVVEPLCPCEDQDRIKVSGSVIGGKQAIPSKTWVPDQIKVRQLAACL